MQNLSNFVTLKTSTKTCTTRYSPCNIKWIFFFTLINRSNQVCQMVSHSSWQYPINNVESTFLVYVSTKLLYTNLVHTNAKSHCTNFSPTKHLNRFIRCLLATLVYPLSCERYRKLKCKFVSSLFPKVL